MKSYKNITEYMRDVPKEHRGYVKTVRELVRKLAPKGEETIRYGMPTMQTGGKNLFHFAAMKSHFGFYPAPSGIIAFKTELDKMGMDYSKGCIRFPYNKALPIALISKIIRFRVKEQKGI